MHIRYAANFLTWFGHDFSAGQFVSVRSVTLSRQRHDIKIEQIKYK